MGSTAEAIREYAQTLTVAQGEHRGKPLRLFPYQERFIDGGWPDDEYVPELGLSMGRSNGKTPTAAIIGAAYTDGPLAEPQSEVICIASRYSQSLLLVRHIAAFLKPQMALYPSRWKVIDNERATSIWNKHKDVRVIGLAAKAAGIHGRPGNLYLIDEPAKQAARETGPIYAACQTGLGKFPNAKLIALGTRSESDGHWFNRGLQGGFDFALSYHVDAGAPLTEANHRLANPAWDYLYPLRQSVLKAAKRARADSIFRPTFDSLHHNSGTAEVGRDMPLTVEIHKRIQRTAADMPPRAGAYALGFDPGASLAMTAAAACWWDTGRCEILAAFPRYPGLQERGARDGVGGAYEEMARERELIGLGSRTVPYGEFLAQCFDRWGEPEVILCDRFQIARVLEGLADVGFPADRVHWRGMGWLDGSEDLERFRDMAADGRINIPDSKLMKSAAAAGICIANPAGSWKLARAVQSANQVQRGRDDALAALILAVAEAHRRKAREPVQAEYVAGSFF